MPSKPKNSVPLIVHGARVLALLLHTAAIVIAVLVVFVATDKVEVLSLGFLVETELELGLLIGSAIQLEVVAVIIGLLATQTEIQSQHLPTREPPTETGRRPGRIASALGRDHRANDEVAPTFENWAGGQQSPARPLHGPISTDAGAG